jgi:PTS system mannose-specific IIA component
MLATAIDLMGQGAPGTLAVAIDDTMDRSDAWAALMSAHKSVDAGAGVLILVDMFGSAPCSMAMSLLGERKVEVLTGLNLAMVLRAILQRRDMPLKDLSVDVLSYGARNVTSAASWLSKP